MQEWVRHTAGVAQLVERKPSKLDVAGSSPVSRFEQRCGGTCGGTYVAGLLGGTVGRDCPAGMMDNDGWFEESLA